MSSRLIQSIFFMCICSSLHTMNKKQKDIVHAKLYEKHEIVETTKPYRTIMQPLPPYSTFNRSKIRAKIRANHMKDLHSIHQHQQVLDSYEAAKHYIPEDLSILKPETQKTYRSIKKSYISAQDIIETNNRILEKINREIALIENKNNRALAFAGDKNAQTLIAEQYINKLSNITNAPEMLEAIKSQNCLYAYELLDFTTALNDRNIPLALTNLHDKQLIDIRNATDITNPSVAYIIQSIRYLQPLTEYKKNLCYNNLLTMTPETAETAIVCQFLINYGDNTLSPQDVVKKFIDSINNCGNDTSQIIQIISNCKNNTLSPQDIAEQLKQSVTSQKTGSNLFSEIAKNPLCSKVIQKLSNVTFDSKDPIIPEINYIFAELYYANKEYAHADTFYKKSTFKLLKEKNARLHAFQACIRGSQISDAQDITYLFYLTDNVYNQLQEAIEKDVVSLSTIITQLSKITLESNHPFLQDFNYVLAELYYKDKNYTQADNFYKKNTVAVLKEKKVQYHAFTANIATSESFNKQDINYLSSLVGNVYNQLKKMDTSNPTLSYKAGLLIQALVNNNPSISTTDKLNMMLDALRCLEHAQKDNLLPSEYQQKASLVSIELHTTLSTIYTSQNNHVTALKHTKQALLSCAQNDATVQEYAMAEILDNAEKNSPEFYKKHAQLIQHIIDFIITENHTCGISKNYTPPTEFISSDLCKQLLPYCEQVCQQNKNSNNEIMYLIAFSHQNYGNNDKACEYIDKLSQPLANHAQLLKTQLYLATKKTLSDRELESTFTAFVRNKKSTSVDQETVQSLIMLSNNFFAQSQYHDLAIKLITKLSDKQPTPAAAIQLAIYITERLRAHNSPEATQWQKKLNTCLQFYTNIAKPSFYNGETNFAAGLLLGDNESVSDNDRIISHFIAALDSKELLPGSIEIAKKGTALAYNKLATASIDHNESITYFDKALQYDNNSELQFKKAMIILDNSNDQELINCALQLLENIPQDNHLFILSRLALAQAYCNHSIHIERMPMLAKLVPLNIEKAINYLENHNNNEKLLQPLVSILAGESLFIPKNIAPKYANLEKAIQYLTILINNNPTNIDRISLRMELHAKLSNIDEALADVHIMLKCENISNTRGITKDLLLLEKIELLTHKTTDDIIYDEIFECFKQLTASDPKNIIHFNTFPLIQERTEYLVINNITTEKAIEWCCFAANSRVAAESATQELLSPTETEKKLANYILLAAKANNLHAQLIVLPYLNATASVSTTNITEALYCSRQALFNKNSIQKRANVVYLIDLLQTYTKNGFALAYYILCDYYKEVPKELERMMLLFNQAKDQEHPEDDATDLIETICSSCEDTLKTYAKQHIENLNEQPLIDAIATFTLGAMYHYNNSKKCTPGGISYLEIAEKTLCYKFKLIQYWKPINRFLSSSYYESALEEKKATENMNYELLLKSARLGYLPATHALANIYIENHKNNAPNNAITGNDIKSLLKRTLENPKSNELFQACKTIIESQSQKQSVVENKNSSLMYNRTSLNTWVSNQTKTTKEIKQNVSSNPAARADLIRQSSLATNLVKHTDYKESNKQYNQALDCMRNNQNKKAAALLQQVAKQSHPNANLLIALIYIAKEATPQDYQKIESTLLKAFSCGLVKHNKTKLFHNKVLLHILIQILEGLIIDKDLEPMKPHFLPIINKALTDNTVDMKSFCALFEEINSIDLSSIPEWTGKSTIDQLPTVAINTTQSLIKNINDTELSPTIAAAFQAQTNKDISTMFALLKNAAHEQNIPSAHMILASLYLHGNDVEVNNNLAATYLHNALACGLIDNKFCDVNFLNVVCSYIDQLVNSSLKPSDKKNSLQTIKRNLIEHNIDLTIFCNTVKESVKIDLTLYPEWTETNTPDKELPKPIKYPDHEETCINYLGALKAIREKDYKNGLVLMRNAANTNEHPTACLFMSSYYYRGNIIEKDDNMAAMYLAKALAYGLIDHHFCTFQFLEALCPYIHCLITEKYSTAPLLLKIIKDTLIKQNFNLPYFYEIYKEYNKTELSSAPEWTGTDTNSKPSIDELKRQLIKDLSNNTVSDDFKKAFTAVIQKDIAKSVVLMNIAAKNNDPCAGITIATNSLLGREGMEKDLLLTLGSLQDTLNNGLIEPKNDSQKGQFCNSLFLKKLCQFVQNVTSMPYETHEIKLKRLLLLHIKESLTQHKIDHLDFCEIVLHETQIDLATHSDWLEAEKDSQLTQEELNRFREISRQKENFIINEFPQKIVEQENKLVKNLDYEESPAFLKAMETMEKGDIPSIKRCMELTKDIADKKNHPQACIIISSEYLRGQWFTKNIPIAEKYLKIALNYGVSEKQLCNNPFLQALCSYIYVAITDRPKNIKQKFLSIIKKDFETKNVDIELFEGVFEKLHKIKLSTVPEWK